MRRGVDRTARGPAGRAPPNPPSLPVSLSLWAALPLERIRQPRRECLGAWSRFLPGPRCPGQDHDAGELGERVEVASVAFVARDEAAEAQHPGKEALDVPTSAIAPQGATVLGLGLSPRVVRRDQLDAVVA